MKFTNVWFFSTCGKMTSYFFLVKSMLTLVCKGRVTFKVELIAEPNLIWGMWQPILKTAFTTSLARDTARTQTLAMCS